VYKLKHAAWQQLFVSTCKAEAMQSNAMTQHMHNLMLYLDGRPQKAAQTYGNHKQTQSRGQAAQLGRRYSKHAQAKGQP
jgi:hypothetical protein